MNSRLNEELLEPIGEESKGSIDKYGTSVTNASK